MSCIIDCLRWVGCCPPNNIHPEEESPIPSIASKKAEALKKALEKVQGLSPVKPPPPEKAQERIQVLSPVVEPNPPPVVRHLHHSSSSVPPWVEPVQITISAPPPKYYTLPEMEGVKYKLVSSHEGAGAFLAPVGKSQISSRDYVYLPQDKWEIAQKLSP